MFTECKECVPVIPALERGQVVAKNCAVVDENDLMAKRIVNMSCYCWEKDV